MSLATAGILYNKSASFRCVGRLFHSPGPAAANSPNTEYRRCGRMTWSTQSQAAERSSNHNSVTCRRQADTKRCRFRRIPLQMCRLETQ